MAIDFHAAEEQFQSFLVLMDEQIEWLESEARTHDIDISVSGDTVMLQRLESLFDVLSGGKDRDEIAGLNVVFARFLGEWLRLHFGGAWRLPLDDPKNVNFNTPVIEGHTRIPGLQFAPILAMRAYSLRRKPGVLLQAITAQVDPKTLDLTDLQEED
jgi:hypothetical protein